MLKTSNSSRTTRFGWPTALVVLSVVMWLVGPSTAQAAGTYNLYGTTTDVLGRPLAGVTIRNGGQTTVTNAAGDYTLSQTAPGSYTLRASRSDLGALTKTVDVLVPVDTRTDFGLLYRLGGEVDRNILSTVSATDVTLTAFSTVPMPGVGSPGGSCVRARLAGHPELAASLVDVAADGSSTWQATFTLQAGSPQGVYVIEYWAIECSSGLFLSGVSGRTFIVDNTAPTVADPAPVGWASHSPVLSVEVDDEWGINTSLSHLSLDGTALSTSLDSTSSRLRAATNALSEGHHNVEAVVVDHAGNTATYSFGFDVDTTAPLVGGTSPTGVVNDMTPTITAGVSDDSSGVDGASIRLVLSNGVLTCELPATWNQSRGEVSYQVPATIQGACLGRGPLPPGAYWISLAVRDHAANTSQYSWTFEVSADDPLQQVNT